MDGSLHESLVFQFRDLLENNNFDADSISEISIHNSLSVNEVRIRGVHNIKQAIWGFKFFGNSQITVIKHDYVINVF